MLYAGFFTTVVAREMCACVRVRSPKASKNRRRNLLSPWETVAYKRDNIFYKLYFCPSNNSAVYAIIIIIIIPVRFDRFIIG